MLADVCVHKQACGEVLARPSAGAAWPGLTAAACAPTSCGFPFQALGAEFEIDFINLSYTRAAEDVREARR